MALLASGSAAAHAPPEATGILWASNGAGERNVVRTNRGLIVSEDGGKTFRLLCNDAFGASLTEVAPFVTTSTGQLLVATYLGGLFAASPDLCSFAKVAGPLGMGTNVVALERAQGAPRTFFATVAHDGSADHLFTSTDDGMTWQAPSRVEDFLFSVKAAPSDPTRLYATSLHQGDAGPPVYRVLVSSDGGKTFVVHPLTLDPAETSLSVLAVDASVPDRAFVRIAMGDPTVAERLLRTDDGGKNFVEVMRLVTPSSAVTNADGATVWVGGGEALFRSTDHGKSFTQLATAGVSQVACLALHAGKLFACGLSNDTYGVLQSSDEGDSFSFFLRFPDVTAPLECAPSSGTGMACATRFEDWRVEQGLSAAGAGGTTSSTAGAGGEAPSGGTAGTPNAGGTPNLGAAPGGGMPTAARTSTASCGCRLDRKGRSEPLPLPAVVALALLGLRRVRPGSDYF